MPKCEDTPHAWCSLVSRPPDPEESERCFGRVDYCERYRARVRRHGYLTGACEAK